MAKAIRRNVTFELPADVLTALENDAAFHKVKSRSLRARKIVTDYLSNLELVDLRKHIGAIDADIAHLTTLVRMVEFSLLVHVAGRTSKEANEFIREHMPTKSNRQP